MNTTQKVALAISILGFLAGAGSQLTDILAPLGAATPLVVKEIVSLAGFAGGILGIVMTNLTSQTAQIKAVAAMDGFKTLPVDLSKANDTVKELVKSDDPAFAKVVAAKPGA